MTHSIHDSAASPHPFSALTPDLVLDALASVGLYGDGRLLALNSYENRVYQVGMEEGAPVVVKFYRPQRWSDDAILEEHAFVAELAAAEIPAVAPLEVRGATLSHFDRFRFAVFPRRGGRSPELDNPATLEWIGRYIGRIHAVGAARPFAARPAISIERFGIEPSNWLLGRASGNSPGGGRAAPQPRPGVGQDGQWGQGAHGFIPPDLHDAYQAIVGQALDGVRACFDRCGAFTPIRLHGDCHGGNVLWTDDGPHFVDFDDAMNGPAVQDLWMLLSGEREEMRRQLADVLAGYEDICEFDPRQLYLIEALRTLRLIHYAAWLARRWDDPAFPAAFPWFNTPQYWQNRILELREQVALMQEPPLWPV